MKRGRHQALYKYLPGMWISEKDGTQRSVSALVRYWNTVGMSGIYSDFIEREIKRQIACFGKCGGDISSFNLDPGQSTFHIVEAACNEGNPDVTCYISPLVFYCSSCHHTFKLRSSKEVNHSTWTCPKCGKKTVKQLQMVYTCECGYAQGIDLPFVPGVHEFLYKPNEEHFKMFHYSGKNLVKDELRMQCPTCKNILLPDNANASRNYKPFALHIINLVDDKSGKFYAKGIDAQKTIVAKWFGMLPQENYEELLDDVDAAFSPIFRDDSKRKDIEKKVDKLIELGLIAPDKREESINSMMDCDDNTYSIDNCVRYFDQLNLPAITKSEDYFSDWLSHYSFKLMQYETLKHPKQIITLEETISRQMEMGIIETPDEIYQLNEKLGIANMQVSLNIEIINCTYGYTRKVADPAQSQNANCQLKLNAYDKDKSGTKNKVFASKLETEGILFEISLEKIIRWLHCNHIISDSQLPDLEDPESVKKWFVEYVHSDKISTFSEIDAADRITKAVFALLHSMSHAFIRTAGELSGLSENSLSENISVETASIFIYAQSSQGVPLGALSGMAETRYKPFLEKAYEANRNCIFDPICSGDKSACQACLIISEVSCHHFNNELGRKYLYTIPSEKEELIGFWDCGL